MTDDLLDWLREQLDADERAANAAIRPRDNRWRSDRSIFDPYGNLEGQYAEHIARHDPTHVLRQVAAHRAILDRYEDCRARLNDPEHSTVEAAGQLREYVDFVLPGLIAIYADRPGYREEWRL